jgi:hypothetical protein
MKTTKRNDTSESLFDANLRAAIRHGEPSRMFGLVIFTKIFYKDIRSF